MKKNLLTILLLFSCISFVLAQNRVITGKVTDQKDGSPLPGVSVTVKGVSSTGTQTSVKGTYSLSVPAGPQVLVFSFLGYKTLTFMVNGKVQDVKLEQDSKQFTEVV